MKYIATLLVVATFIYCTYGQIIPTVYTGPIISPAANPVTGADVGLPTAFNFVLQWSQAVLTANRAARVGLFNFTRIIALTHVAMHDTVQGYDRVYATYQSGLPVPTRRSNVNAAIIGAAYTIFFSYFGSNVFELSKYNSIVAFQTDFLRRNGVSDRRIINGFDYGRSVAAALLALRANDGFNVRPVFVPQTALGFWQPTPPDFAPAAGVGWPAVTPWRLSNNISTYFPPDGNTYITNRARYIIDYAEEIGRGRDTNKRQITTVQRTATETFIAVFWANDFAGTSLPPGQYLETVQLVAASLRLNRSNYTRFLALNAIMIANVNIVAWAVKYQFQEWRPVTAIQAGGIDNEPATVGDPTWVPLSITSPAFPDYISGHATFGYGLAQMLRLLTGSDNTRVSIPSDNLPQVLATYRTFSDIAIDNADSRIFLGVHFRAAVDDALITGNAIANDIYNNVLRPL